jgi:arylsulfatase A-like enzyme
MRFIVLALVLTFISANSAFAGGRKPNIVMIYIDDLGYGDVGCYGATRVKTPNVDRLAREGLRFTDGHSPSATCTPSRYSLLTGEYAWRRKGTGILPGDAALIIEPGRPTLPSILKQGGYTTGVVGKWHLGLGTGALDWNGEINPGPLEIGFDHAFIMAATGDRVPCVYVEDHRVVGLDAKDPIRVRYGEKIGDEPTGREHPELLKMKPSEGHADTIVNGISRIGFMAGGKSARWVDEDMADTFTQRAVRFIESNKDKPFFLYFATHDVHVPRVPAKRFRGTSGCGVRGDVIQEMDWSVGRILDALDRLKVSEDTLLIFTSDNGPVVDDGYADGATRDLNGHKPAGPWRGTKYTPFEGGTRVPWIVRWPGRLKPGATSDALVCQIDLLRSLAKLAEAIVPQGAGPDSHDVLAALLGESTKGREDLVEHSRRLAYRQGNWKLIDPAGKELYDLASDPAEQNNLAQSNPDKVEQLSKAFAAIRGK